MKLQTTIALVVFLLAALTPVFAQEGTASSGGKHTSLAAYFTDLAAQEQALAKSYDRLAALYKAKSALPDLDAAAAREIRNQLKRLAETEKRAAAAAASTAAYHRRLAETVSSLTAPATVQSAKLNDSAFRR